MKSASIAPPERQPELIYLGLQDMAYLGHRSHTTVRLVHLNHPDHATRGLQRNYHAHNGLPFQHALFHFLDTRPQDEVQSDNERQNRGVVG